jgi:peptidyl-prolyl cis-trans isomerase C
MIAQTPPPKPAAAPQSTPARPASPAPAPAKPASTPAQPTVTLSADNAPPAAAPVLPPDKVVLTVGDQKMTYAQFEAIVNSLPEQSRATARGPARKQFAENLVRIMVLSEEGKRRKIDQSPTYKIQSAFQAQNVLAGAAYEDINKNMKVDDAELRKYYDEHKQEFEQVHARHILIRMQGSPVPVRPGQKDLTDAEALAKAQELRKKIVAGADFATLAIAESDDQGSGAKGGDLGFFKKQQMVPTFEQAAFAMKPGELSEPVKTQFGYHIIKVEAHEDKSLEDVRADLETRLRPEMVRKYMDDLQQKTAVTYDPEMFGAAK